MYEGHTDNLWQDELFAPTHPRLVKWLSQNSQMSQIRSDLLKNAL